MSIRLLLRLLGRKSTEELVKFPSRTSYMALEQDEGADGLAEQCWTSIT
jgi:hypothetical protein